MAGNTTAKDHRAALGALAALTAAVLVLSFLQFKNSVRAPFERRGPGYQSLAEREAAAAEAEKTTDTDNDGLSDYDELYVFRTSPYLEDTDSDGINDGTEVNSNQDPNCPQGKSCDGGGEAVSEAGRTFEVPNSIQPNLNFAGGASLLAEFDPESVRALLRGAGVADDVLSKVDDETLKKLYEQALQQTASSTVTSTAR